MLNKPLWHNERSIVYAIALMVAPLGATTEAVEEGKGPPVGYRLGGSEGQALSP